MKKTSVRSIRPGLLRALALVAFGLLSGTAGADLTRLELAPTSELRLAGTTNLHAWQCRSTELEADAHLAASPVEIRSLLDRLEHRAIEEGPILDPGTPRGLDADFRLSVPVLALDCGNERMERDLRSTLRATEHPAIRYRFEGVQEASLAPSDRGVPPRLVLVVTGEISLAGTDRPVVFPVEGRRLAADRLQLRARVSLKMTDFGIEPPVALFGLIRAENRLTVEVNLLLVIAGPPAATGIERYGATHPGERGAREP